MALTNFAALTQEQLTVWSRTLWKAARNMSFLNRFVGSDANAVIQRVTELKKTDKGARAVITLIADLEGDGVAGDNQLEGNEEALQSHDQVIGIDQLRHANRNKGRLAEQKSVVNFRENSRDVLAYWLADRMDQLGFLTLSGVSYSQKTNGAARVGSAFPDLEFASDVTAPTANRFRRWSAASGLVAGDTTAVTASDKPSYAMLVEMKAYAKTNFVRGIKGAGGEEYFHVLMTPQGMAKLKLDPDYLANLRNGAARSDKNPLFTGADVTVDGLVISEFRHVYNTKGVASGSKWGSAGAVDGQRVLFLGAQAMGMADIGAPEWVEKDFDYGNSQGISVAKMLGLKKPVFKSQVTGTNEDFGLLVCDTAI